MPLSISRLRHWFAGTAIAVVLLVGGMYFYARHRVQNALKQVPEKIGLEIKQSATGFTVSKSEQGRTLFRIEASKAVQFKQGGHAELHDVTITLYGRDSGRYDQIYGSDFGYDQPSGNISARGEVQIDLEANPEGILNPDQAAPKELKNPIHLKTSGLVFNQKTGNASTKEKVEFRLPQGSGSATGVKYVAKTNVLTLESQVQLVANDSAGLSINAARAAITKDPHQVVLEHPQLATAARHCESDSATLFLREDNTLDRILAAGNVHMQADGPQPAEVKADQLELTMGKKSETARTAIFTGNVMSEMQGPQPMQASAGRVILDFAGKNLLTKVHSEDQVKLVQHQSRSGTSSVPQDMELTAAAVDFFLTNGKRLERAETAGSAQVALRPRTPAGGPQTLVTAGKFEGRFDPSGQVTSIHGAPDARIVSQNPGQPDRVSASTMVDATFHPGGGMTSITQQGNVTFVDGQRKAWGERARYTPSDQILLLTGSPRVVEGGMTTTGQLMRLNRASGDAFAEGEVKSTYSDLKSQPNGALLASSSPIHVTSQSMSVHGASAVALYGGGARLWQDANIVEAPSIEFDRDHRSMIAHATPGHPVSTVLVDSGKDGKSIPIAITSSGLTYTDTERKAHFEGEVMAKGADFTVIAKQMDVFFAARGQVPSSQQAASAGKLDRIVASGQVVVTEPGRRANGDQLVYTAPDDKFVLTGGPPSIFDAERGKITGVSLTFYRHDDRVLVEGSVTSPTVTRTRVAR
ncbi:MAG: LPS export ABC transporter periplasmic protein LptC [Terriglobales bacterium]